MLFVAEVRENAVLYDSCGIDVSNAMIDIVQRELTLVS